MLYQPRIETQSQRRCRRCQICGQMFERRTSWKQLCGRRKCRLEFRRQKAAKSALARVVPPAVSKGLKTPTISTPCEGKKPGRGWRQIAGLALDQEQIRIAVLGAIPPRRPAALFTRDTPPTNLVGGVRFSGAPVLRASLKRGVRS